MKAVMAAPYHFLPGIMVASSTSPCTPGLTRAEVRASTSRLTPRSSQNASSGEQAPYALIFGMETHEDTRPILETDVVFGLYWLVCGQSSTSSENGLDPCRGAIGESPTGSLREVIVPRAGFAP